METIPTIDMVCPECGAKPGQVCVTTNGNPIGIMHRQREMEVDKDSIEYLSYIFNDEDGDVYAMNCPQCGRNSIAKKDDYICVNCRKEA